MRYTEKVVSRVNTIRFQDFDTIADFQEHLATSKPNRHFSTEKLISEDKDRYAAGWTGTKDMAEAQHLFRTGWNAFAEKLTKATKTPTVSANVQRSKPSYGMVGGQASVPRYIQGIPTNMVDRKPVQQKQKIIVINKDIWYSAMISAETIEKEGVKALQIIQLLESKGFRVKLNVYGMTSSHGETLGFRLTVKKPEERLSLAKVAFPIAHPSYLRRIGFAWLERFNTMKEASFTHGYGMPSGSKVYDFLGKDTKEIVLPNFIPDVHEYVAGLGY